VLKYETPLPVFQDALNLNKVDKFAEMDQKSELGHGSTASTRKNKSLQLKQMPAGLQKKNFKARSF
jgi:hypothetical protein